MAAEHVDAVSKAVESLLKWHKAQLETEKPKLFGQDEEFVYLILTLKKIPQKGRVNPHKVPIPHSLLSASSEQCLIIDDRPKSLHVTKKDAQKKIQSESIPITKVLKLSKLASDYRPFEAKRKLCNSYDLFFAEKSVVPLLPRLLGKQFFKKRKLPVQLDLKKKNWKEQVERACASAMLFLRTGTCSVIKVAKLSMEKDEIVENVIAAMDGVIEIVPKKWANVRSFHVKLLESVALPIYQVVPDVKLKIEGVRDIEAALKKEEKKKVRDAKVGKNKKGRIHEIKYMDDKMSEDGTDVDGTDADDGGEDEARDDNENGERGNGGLVSNKRKKKGVKAKREASSERELKDSAKRRKKDGLSAKSAEEGLIKKSGNKLSVKDDGLSKKKKKGGEPSKKKKKGAELDDVDGDAIDDGGEDGEATGGVDYENGETVNGGLVSKKRKKGIKAKKGDSSELLSVTPSKDSAKGKKKDVLSVKAAKVGSIKKSGNKLSVEDGSSGKKKIKTGGKVKAKKSKKAA